MPGGLLLDACYDWILTRAEQADETRVREVERWLRRLNTPPTMPMDDKARMFDAAAAAFTTFVTETARRLKAGVTFTPDDEDAPPGWSNAELIALLQASEAADR